MKMWVLAVAAALQYLSFHGLALAKCGASDHVYVDPMLVPTRPRIPQEQMQAVNSNPWITPEQKAYMMDLYTKQNQPIQMPFDNGYVLISPLDPCIQQFIPLR